jgi:predicted transcriptional regulator
MFKGAAKMKFNIYNQKQLRALKATYGVEIEEIARALGTNRKQIYRVINDENASLAFKIAVTEYFKELIRTRNGSVQNPIDDLPDEAKRKLGAL